MDCEANDEGCNAWEEEGGRSNMQINTVYKQEQGKGEKSINVKSHFQLPVASEL